MEPLLNGYNAFITGAASGMYIPSALIHRPSASPLHNFLNSHVVGIGKATALHFARHGAAGLAIADINKDALDTLAATLARDFPAVKVVPIVLDVTSAAAVKAAVARTVQELGRLDVGVNNAGATGTTSLTHELPEESWDRTLSLDLNAVFYCQKEELAVMVDQECVHTLREFRPKLLFRLLFLLLDRLFS